MNFSMICFNNARSCLAADICMLNLKFECCHKVVKLQIYWRMASRGRNVNRESCIGNRGLVAETRDFLPIRASRFTIHDSRLTIDD